MFRQTLTTLHLKRNEIGDQGAKHLANALQQNKVRVHIALVLSQLIVHSSVSIDTYHT